MERLNVITVQADDLDNPGTLHTTYTVYSGSGDGLRASSGWTLRDAITFYARDYGVAGTRYALIRPFWHQ